MGQWGVSYISIIDRIEEIRDDIKAACYQSALALALTSPDICGQVAHPELVVKVGENKGKRIVGEQYAAWFDENVRKYYIIPTINEQNGITNYHPYFTGKMCYLLRCSFLHSADSSIGAFEQNTVNATEGIKYCYRFELSIDSESVGKIEDSDRKMVRMELRINIINLCSVLCDEAQQYYNNSKCKTSFEEHSYRLISVKDFANELKKHNT